MFFSVLLCKYIKNTYKCVGWANRNLLDRSYLQNPYGEICGSAGVLARLAIAPPLCVIVTYHAHAPITPLACLPFCVQATSPPLIFTTNKKSAPGYSRPGFVQGLSQCLCVNSQESTGVEVEGRGYGGGGSPYRLPSPIPCVGGLLTIKFNIFVAEATSAKTPLQRLKVSAARLLQSIAGLSKREVSAPYGNLAAKLANKETARATKKKGHPTLESKNESGNMIARSESAENICTAIVFLKRPNNMGRFPLDFIVQRPIFASYAGVSRNATS